MQFELSGVATRRNGSNKPFGWCLKMVVLLVCADTTCCSLPLDPAGLPMVASARTHLSPSPLHELASSSRVADLARSAEGDTQEWFVPLLHARSVYSAFHSPARRIDGKQNGLNLFAHQLLRYLQDFGHVRVTRNWEPLRKWCQTIGEERIADGLPDGVTALVLEATPTIKRCTSRSQARKRAGPVRTPSPRTHKPLFSTSFPEVPTNLRDMLAYAKLGTWEKKFCSLLRFRMMFGHCHCPFDAKEQWIGSLHSWSAQQRKAWKDGTGVLALFPSTSKRLTAAGFSWDPWGENWEGHYQSLLLFRMRYGHASPLSLRERSRERKALAMFLRRMRLLRRRGQLSEDKTDKLAGLGVSWVAATTRVSWEDEDKRFRRAQKRAREDDEGTGQVDAL